MPLFVSVVVCFCRCLFLSLFVSAVVCFCRCLFLPLFVSAIVCFCRCLFLPLFVSAVVCFCCHPERSEGPRYRSRYPYRAHLSPRPARARSPQPKPPFTMEAGPH